jgi:hypothetical protein
VEAGDPAGGAVLQRGLDDRTRLLAVGLDRPVDRVDGGFEEDAGRLAVSSGASARSSAKRSSATPLTAATCMSSRNAATGRSVETRSRSARVRYRDSSHVDSS